MVLNHGYDLFSREFVIRQWDGTEEAVKVTQCLGNRWGRYLNGPVVVSAVNGDWKHTTSMDDFCRSVCGEILPEQGYASEVFGHVVTEQKRTIPLSLSFDRRLI